MTDLHMARIPKEHFAEVRDLPYDVFVRLGQDHFILVGRRGRPSTIHRLKAFHADLVPWFYVSRSDFPVHVNDTVKKALDASDRFAVLSAVGGALGALWEMVRVDGFTPEAWAATDQLSSRIVEAAITLPSNASLLGEIEKLGERQLRHAVAVSMVSVMIARESGFGTEELKDLSTAGLLHDVGWLKLPSDLVTQRTDLLEKDKLASYQDHPDLGADLLKDCSQVPEMVVRLVREHHENALGTGFPHGLKAEQLTRCSGILSLAERFCELTVGDSMHVSGMSAQAALNTIATMEGHPYPKDQLLILESLIRSGRIHSI